jgi:hypothetical protein
MIDLALSFRNLPAAIAASERGRFEKPQSYLELHIARWTGTTMISRRLGTSAISAA